MLNIVFKIIYKLQKLPNMNYPKTGLENRMFGI